jgi:hypothetical protein
MSWAFSPYEEVLCSSKANYKRRTGPRQNVFVSEIRLEKIKLQNRKLSWVGVDEEFGFRDNFSVIFNDT